MAILPLIFNIQIRGDSPNYQILLVTNKINLNRYEFRCLGHQPHLVHSKCRVSSHFPTQSLEYHGALYQSQPNLYLRLPVRKYNMLDLCSSKGSFQFDSVHDVEAIKYTYNLKPILLVQILEHWQGLSSINFQSLLVCFGIVLPSYFSSPRKIFSQFYFRAIDQHQNWSYANLWKANDAMLVISTFQI